MRFSLGFLWRVVLFSATNAYSSKHNEEQNVIYSFMQTKADCHAQNSVRHEIQ